MFSLTVRSHRGVGGDGRRVTMEEGSSTIKINYQGSLNVKQGNLMSFFFKGSFRFILLDVLRLQSHNLDFVWGVWCIEVRSM